MKKFLFVLAALVSVSLVLAGCDNPETETKYVNVPVPDVIHVDKAVDTVSDLATAWDDGSTVVEFKASSAATLTYPLTIPKDKVLVLRSSLTPATAGITVAGTVYVEEGGILVAESTKPVIVTDGVLYVNRGALSVDAAASVNNGAAPSATVLGTDKVGIAGGTLKITTVADKDGLVTALGYVTSGTLEVTNALTTASKPSEIAGIGSISASRKLVLTAAFTVAETAANLPIPAGLTLNAGSLTLDSVTTLTVNGSLTASGATLAAATALTVNGELTASSATGDGTNGIAITVGAGGSATVGTISKLLASSVAAGGTLTATGATLDTSATLAVGAGAEVNGIKFPGATTISALAANALTIGNFTVPAGKTLTVGNGKTLTVGSLVLTGAAGTGGAKLAGEGKVVAAKTEITGGASGIWQAVGTGTVTIAATNANASSITASAGTVTLTATATGATITQAAGASNALTIAASTTINLAGTESTAAGSIVLTGAASNPGEIKLADATTSIVKTGVTAGTGAFSTAAKIGGKTFAAGTSGTAAITTDKNAAAGKFASMAGGGTANYGLKGGDADNTITINSVAEVAATG